MQFEKVSTLIRPQTVTVDGLSIRFAESGTGSPRTMLLSPCTTPTDLSAICQHGAMSAPHITRVLGVAVAMTLALASGPTDIPSASADPCPDVEVVFAR